MALTAELRRGIDSIRDIGGLARMKQTFGGDEGLAGMLRSMNAAVFHDEGLRSSDEAKRT